MKAGKVASGEFSTERAVKSGKASVVLVAKDASGNTKKMFANMCTYYKVPIYFFSEKEAIGAALGKGYRASMAVTDAGFGKAIEKAIENENVKMMSDENGGSKYGKNED